MLVVVVVVEVGWPGEDLVAPKLALAGDAVVVIGVVGADLGVGRHGGRGRGRDGALGVWGVGLGRGYRVRARVVVRWLASRERGFEGVAC